MDSSDEIMDQCGENVSLYYFVTNLMTLHFPLAKWSCDEKQFQCGKNDPKCITMVQVCNGNRDCSDGSDELPQLCGETLKFEFVYVKKQNHAPFV